MNRIRIPIVIAFFVLLFSTQMAYPKSRDHQATEATQSKIGANDEALSIFKKDKNWQYYCSAPGSYEMSRIPKRKLTKEDLNEQIIVYPHEPAEFPGGKKAMREWIDKDIRYPEELQNKTLEDTISCSLLIEKDGSIALIRVSGVQDPAFAKEIFRLVRKMPKFTPAKDLGKTFAYYYNFPIKFRPQVSSNSKTAKVAPQDKEDYEDQRKPSDDDDVFRTCEYSHNRYPIPPGGFPEETEGGYDKKVFSPEEIHQPAKFPGGDLQMINWINRKLKYPKSARKNKIEGTVMVKFIIEKNGSLSEVRVTRRADKDLAKEALRIVKKMPKWRPAKINGVPVRSYYYLPINFSLSEDNNPLEKEQLKVYNKTHQSGRYYPVITL